MPETQIGCKSPTTADPDAQWVRRSGFKRSSHTERLTYLWCQAHPRSNPHGSGKGLDLEFTARGHDAIATGAGDDFIMSGGLGAVASMQSEDPANQVPEGATWVRAGMGSWGLYNDSANGDLGEQFAPYGISTAQVWQAGGGSPKGPRSPKSGDDYQDIAIWLIAINDHPTLGTGRFDCKYGELTACGAWFWFRQKRPRPDTCRRATNDGTIRSAA